MEYQRRCHQQHQWHLYGITACSRGRGVGSRRKAFFIARIGCVLSDQFCLFEQADFDWCRFAQPIGLFTGRWSTSRADNQSDCRQVHHWAFGRFLFWLDRICHDNRSRRRYRSQCGQCHGERAVFNEIWQYGELHHQQCWELQTYKCEHKSQCIFDATVGDGAFRNRYDLRCFAELGVADCDLATLNSSVSWFGTPRGLLKGLDRDRVSAEGHGNRPWKVMHVSRCLQFPDDLPRTHP